MEYNTQRAVIRTDRPEKYCTSRRGIAFDSTELWFSFFMRSRPRVFENYTTQHITGVYDIIYNINVQVGHVGRYKRGISHTVVSLKKKKNYKYDH